MDQPSVDGLNTYVVSRAVSRHGIKVVLSGLWGDELFCGYPSFQRAHAIAQLWNLPAVPRRITTTGASLSADFRMERLGGLLRNATPAQAAYLASRTLFSERYNRALAAGKDGQTPLMTTSDLDRAAFSLLQQVSWYEITGYMRNTLPRDCDVFSVAHGLELRVPFVDGEVARAAMSFADSAKLRRGRSKPFLAEAIELSPEIERYSAKSLARELAAVFDSVVK